MLDSILVVEDGSDLYQILGCVANIGEARELARGYERAARPENPNTPVPPTQYVMYMRNPSGYYTIAVPVEIDEAAMCTGGCGLTVAECINPHRCSEGSAR